MPGKALLLTMALLAGCGSTPQPLPDLLPTAAGMASEGADEDAASQDQRPVLRPELLPAFARTGTLKAGVVLLQRPKIGSVILTTLPASQSVQVLGNLDNADGQWLSIGVGDTQGWVRASEVTQP